MAAAMARQEDHVDAKQGAGQQLVGGLAPGLETVLPAGIFQAVNVIDTASRQ